MSERRVAVPGWGELVSLGGIVSATLGLFVLAARLAGRAKLAELDKEITAIEPNTALCFVLCGAGLLFVCRRWLLGARLLGMGAAILASATGLQYLMDVDLGIDQLLLWPQTTVETLHAGRMAPNVALLFALTGLALALMSTPAGRPPRSAASSALGSVVAALAMVALFGQRNGSESTEGWNLLAPMALPVAIGFITQGGSILRWSWGEAAGLHHRRAPTWLPIPISVGALAATLCLWTASSGQKRDSEGFLRTFILPPRAFAEERFPEVILGLGVVVSGLLTLAVYLGQKASLRASERKRAEKALRKARDELEVRVRGRTAELSRLNLELAKADERKNKFLALLGHELRNPLAALTLCLENEDLADPGSADYLENRALMNQWVQYLSRLVDDLLDVSRVSRGKVKLRKSVVEFKDVVSRAIENMKPVIRGHEQELLVSLPSEPVYLAADVVRLQQVVTNLLHNAAKYTKPGGKIWVVAERQRGEVVLRVRDTGIGIPQDLLPRIFEPFEQGARLSGRAEGGLGIGLALVRNLVAMHGGRVEAQSSGAGKGSEFKVSLPILSRVSAGLAKRVNARVSRAKAGGASLRVLVVDDRADIGRLLGRLLKAWGHEVRVAQDGQSALQEASSFLPQVVLVDIGLPGMNGFELARRLRAEARTRKMFLAALTGYAQPEHRRLSEVAGFDRFLVKPVSAEVLRELLTDWSLKFNNKPPPGRRTLPGSAKEHSRNG